MLPRQLAEAKNTIEHNMAAQERAHSVHMTITLFVSETCDRCGIVLPTRRRRNPESILA